MPTNPSQPRDITIEVKPEQPRGALILKLMAWVVVLATLFFFGRQAAGYVLRFAQWVQNLGFWAPAVFILGYALATVAFIPGSVLTLAAGAIFGLAKGTLFVFIAATLGSSLAFLVSRYVARRLVERKLAGHKKFASIDQAIGKQGFKIVLLLRMTPLVPFNFLNYGLGLTRVRFLPYVLASIGMLPGTLLYVYYGKLVGDVAAIAGGVRIDQGSAYYGILVLGLIATILVATLVTRIAKKALKEATGG